MKHQKMFKTVAVFLVLALSTSTIAAEEQAENSNAEGVLELVPAEAFFCGQLSKADYSLGQMDHFMSGVMPFPGGVSAIVRAQLTRLLGSPQLAGVDTMGDFAFFIAPSESEDDQAAKMPFFGGLLAISDYNDFLTVNPNCRPQDANGIFSIESKGKLVGKPIGNYVMITNEGNYEALLKTGQTDENNAGLKDKLDEQQKQKTAEDNIWLYLDIQQTWQQYRDQIEGVLNMMSQAAVQAEQVQPTSAQQAKFGFDIIRRVLEKVMNEGKYLNLSVNPSPEVLRATYRFSAIEGSDLAGMLIAPAETTDLEKQLRFLDDGAVANFAGIYNKQAWEKIGKATLDIMFRMSQDGPSEETIDQLNQATEKMNKALGNSMAGSFKMLPDRSPAMNMQYAAEVTDEQAFLAANKEVMDLWSDVGLFGSEGMFGTKMRYDYQPRADSYKDIPIHSATLRIESADANSPEAQMLKHFYGDGLEYRWAVVEDLGVWGIGDSNSAEQNVREMIDLVRNQDTELSEEVKAAWSLVENPDQQQFFGTYNYVRALAIIALMPSTPMPGLQDVQTSSNLVFYGGTKQGRLDVTLAMPKKHAQEMMMGFMMMQQQMQQQIQQQMQQNQLPNGPMPMPPPQESPN